MNFDSPGSILGEVTQMLLAQQTTMRNRTLICRLFNGEAPSTDEERRAENLKTNVNWLEATRIASNATNQLNAAFFKGDRFFSVTLDKGEVRKRATYSASITKYINRELKRSSLYRASRESAHAQVVLHGPGPQVWRNRRCPIPDVAGLDDIIVPSGTLTSLENLDRFAIHREMTWHQLYDQTQGAYADPGWNTNYVTALLHKMFNTGVVPVYQGNRWMYPEKLAEDIKEGAAQAASSSLPKVMAYDFFYRNEDTDKWNRRMILDYGSIAPDDIGESDPLRTQQSFIYEKDDYADEVGELVHWYFGNCSNVAPYRYYSVRSIGYLLYGPCRMQNMIRNRVADHLMQSLLTLFRNVSDDNREKLQMIDLQNYGVMPDGVSMVPANERHTADWNLILMSLNQNRQLMAESAQGFLPDTIAGEDKVMTAQEFIGRMNMSISLTSAVMSQLSNQSVGEYREICRRFCIKDNPDPMAKRFRENIKKDGVPMDMLDIDAWEVIPEHSSGGGNKAAELNITQATMQEIFPLADPDGQRLIARKRYLALTDNPDEAMLVFPDAPQPPSDDVQYAQVAYTVLMLGVPFAKKEGVNHVAYTGMLMQMMNVTLGQVQQAAEQPQGLAIAADKIVGLFNVATHVQEEINIIGRVDSQVDKAKIMFKALTEMMTALQQVASKLMASEQQQQGGVSPETQAKIQERMLLAENQAQLDAMKAQGKEERSDVKFHSENMRRNAMVSADNERKMIATAADVAAKDLITAAEISRPRPETTSK